MCVCIYFDIYLGQVGQAAMLSFLRTYYVSNNKERAYLGTITTLRSVNVEMPRLLFHLRRYNQSINYSIPHSSWKLICPPGWIWNTRQICMYMQAEQSWNPENEALCMYLLMYTPGRVLRTYTYICGSQVCLHSRACITPETYLEKLDFGSRTSANSIVVLVQTQQELSPPHPYFCTFRSRYTNF